MTWVRVRERVCDYTEAEKGEAVMGKIGIPELILFTIVVAAVLYLTREKKVEKR